MNKEVLYLRWNKRLLKAYFLTQVLSCEISEISKNTFSTEHLPATAFVFWKGNDLITSGVSLWYKPCYKNIVTL